MTRLPGTPRSSLRQPFRRAALGVAVLLACLGSSSRVQAASRLEFISSPASWIGAGESVSVGTDNGFEIKSWSSDPSDVFFSVDNFLHANEGVDAPRWWQLRLSAPSGALLRPGAYPEASLFHDDSVAGLDFFGNGRGNNNQSGSFDVLELAYSEHGDVESFAADFLQYDERDLNAWIKGSIRFNSDLPIALQPEPYTPSEKPIWEPIDGQWQTGELPPEEEIPYPGDIWIDEPFILPISIEFEPGQENPATEWISDPLDGEWGSGDFAIIDPPYVPDDSSEDGVLFPVPISGEYGDVQWPWIWYSSGAVYSVRSVGFEPIALQLPVSSPPAAVPGPLPAAAALMGWGWTRRLRRRCRSFASAPGFH